MRHPTFKSVANHVKPTMMMHVLGTTELPMRVFRKL